MAFPRKLLADHESIVFDLRPHWVALAKPVLWLLLWLAVWITGYQVAKNVLDEPNLTQNIVAIVSLAGILYMAIFPYVKWQSTHFVLTTDRLITRWGVISKNSKEIPLERINDVTFNQSVVDRILGAGDLLVESAGERGQTRIQNVRKPEQVQLMIYKETEDNNNRMMRPSGQPSSAAPSITEQIEALARLKDQGVLSDMEFETKKQELLKRL